VLCVPTNLNTLKMIVFIADRFKKKINFLAYYQIIGGIIGVLLIFWLLVNSQLGGLPLLIILLTLVLFAFSMHCGKLLLDGKIKQGLQFSTINQIFQSINFAIAGFAFKFIAGINLTIGIDLSKNLDFTYNYSLSQFTVNINSQKEIVFVGINLISLSLIFLIGNLFEEHKKEELLKKAESEK
jgi:membrane protease YdiL (CAAX protease family)